MMGRRDERGAVLVIAALSMAVILGASALAFDIGREVDTNRSTQSLADAIALDAANFITGQAAGSADSVSGVAGTTQAEVIQEEAALSAGRNGARDLSGDYVYLCDLATPISSCTGTAQLAECPLVVSSPCSVAPSTLDVDAVVASTAGTTDFTFQSGSATSNRVAVAMKNVGLSQFTVAPTLLSFDNQTVDDLCSVVFTAASAGTCSAGITALSTAGALDAPITLGEIAAADPGVETTGSLLSTAIPSGTALGAVYTALLDQDTPLGSEAASVMNQTWGVTAGGSPDLASGLSIHFCQYVDFLPGGCGPSNETASPSSTLTLGQVLVGLAFFSSASGSVGVSTAGIGLGSLSLLGTNDELAVSGNIVAPAGVSALGPGCEPAGSTTCPTTASSTTTTITVALQSPVTVQSAVPLLGIPAITLDVSLAISASSAAGTLQSVSCGASPSASIKGTVQAVSVTPDVTLTVNGTADPVANLGDPSVGSSTWGPASFAAGQTETFTATNPLSVSGLQAALLPSGLNSDLSSTLSVLGLGSLLSTLLGGVDTNVTSVLTTLTTNTLNSATSNIGDLLQTLGIDLDQATVTDDQITCGPQLVG